ncbi:MAG: YihY/virulence factor BrkB family protein [Aureispira sp.]
MITSFLKTIRKRLYAVVRKIYYHKLLHPIIHPIYTTLRDTIKSYNEHRVFRLGAALAYYTIFSLPALIIVIVGAVGFFLGEAAVSGEIYSNIVGSVGKDAALQIQKAVINIGTPDTSWWAALLGIAVLVFVATGVFYALQDTLNFIFGVAPVPAKMRILEVIMNRILSFAMVLSIGGLLLLSIIFNALMLKASDFVIANQYLLHERLDPKIVPYIQYLTDYFFVGLNLIISIFLITLFFAFLYKILPAVRLRWKFVWMGAFFSAVLFSIGQILMGIYLSKTNMISAYGAAGSIIAILIWVSYSAQLIFLGAEFIIAVCKYNKVDIKPKRFAYALQRSKSRPIKDLSRKQLDELAGAFITAAPPSHSQLREMIEYIDLSDDPVKNDAMIEDIIEDLHYQQELDSDKTDELPIDEKEQPPE